MKGAVECFGYGLFQLCVNVFYSSSYEKKITGTELCCWPVVKRVQNALSENDVHQGLVFASIFFSPPSPHY